MVTGGVEVRVRLTPSSEVRCGDVAMWWWWW